MSIAAKGFQLGPEAVNWVRAACEPLDGQL